MESSSQHASFVQGDIRSNDFDAKLVLLGDTGVGKTSMVMRYIQGNYTESLPSTIGASFFTKRLFVDDYRVKLQIWDTAGQERFRCMSPMYYRGANAAILVYDATVPGSFESVRDWARELNVNVQGDIVIAIAANKSESESTEELNEKVRQYAVSRDALFFKTSAKENKGIEELFIEITKRMLETQTPKGKLIKTKSSDMRNAIDLNASKKETSCC